MYELLKGLRVVELAEWVFVPTGAAILADWGADVIKIEHPFRDDSFRGLTSSLVSAGGSVPSDRPLLEMSNRGKRDIAIDIATPQGLEIPARLVWPDLCRHIGRTDLIDDYRFVDLGSRQAHRAECITVLEGIFATK